MRIDWFDLLAVQGTFKSLLQHHSLKASILRHSAFFIVQSSHPYMTTGKTIALTRRTFVDKVMSLLFNMLSRLVVTSFQGVRVLISWLQSPSAVILEPPKIKSDTVSTVSPSISLREHKAEENCWQVIELKGESQFQVNCSQVMHCCYCLVPQSCPNLSDPKYCNISGFPGLSHLPEFVQTHNHDVIKPSVTPSNLFILCHPLLLPSIFPRIRVFPNA